MQDLGRRKRTTSRCSRSALEVGLVNCLFAARPDAGHVGRFSTPELTIYCVRHSRGHEILFEVQGEEFGGIVGCDGFAAYRLLGCTKAQCIAHLLRRAAELQTWILIWQQARRSFSISRMTTSL